MQAYVFTDRALEQQAGRFVWLQIDTEKAGNAPLREKFPVVALPTYFIVNPADESVALRWVGGATVSQLQGMLDDGRRAVLAGAAGGATTSRAERAFARAERLYGAGDNAGAAAAYGEALAQAAGGWPRYARAVESLLFALQSTGDDERAARLAAQAFPRLRRTPSAANVAASGLGSALELPAEHGARDSLIAVLEADTREVVSDRGIPLAADDRSAAYIALLEARAAAHDSLGALRVASEWAAFLEGEAARAKTPEARAVFDSHRLSAYLELDQPGRALPMLTASERDLPGDYNPPARLAIAYLAMHRWDEALAASDRALAKAYGPRRLRILDTRADIQVGRSDVPAARRTLEDAIRIAEALPAGQRSESSIAGLKQKLDALP